MRTADTSRQLDLFRGFAALLMVLNHAGNAWLSRIDATSGVEGMIVFLGSAAPALFFSATGVGMGLSPRRSPDWIGVGRKVALLVLADVFLGWSAGRWIGLDFFAFCALSMLVVSLVASTPRPVATAVAAIFACLALRYAFVSALQPLTQQYSPLAFLTGIDGVTNVSYPLAPWLVFPLGGFILGRLCTRGASSRRAGLWIDLVLAFGACSAAAVSYVLVERGGVLHRWGSVSIAYFFCAQAIVVFGWLLAGFLERATPGAGLKALETRGPASLVVVPVHYVLIGLAVELGAVPSTATAWLPCALLLGVTAIALSKWIAICLRRLVESKVALRWIWPATVLLAALSVWALSSALPLRCLLFASAGEILIAAILARPGKVVSRADTPRAI